MTNQLSEGNLREALRRAKECNKMGLEKVQIMLVIKDEFDANFMEAQRIAEAAQAIWMFSDHSKRDVIDGLGLQAARVQAVHEHIPEQT